MTLCMRMSGKGKSESRVNRDIFLIDAAGFSRSFGVGFIGVLLGIYLSRLGYSSFLIGSIIGTGLAGTAFATVTVSLIGDRVGRRKSLFVLALMSMFAGLGLAYRPAWPLLASMAFIGMLNGTGTDRSALFALEQAMIPGLVPDTERTWKLAWYNVLLDGGGALGALSAGLPLLVQNRLRVSLLTSYRMAFLGYCALFLLVAGLYSFLSPAVEIRSTAPLWRLRPRVTPKTKMTLTKLTALFALDAFGGGFLTDALVAYWFFRRFGVAEYDLGLLFFGIHLLNACSHFVAAWLARRIGLIRTMVFTHLPSSLFLMAIPLAPSFRWAVLLFLCREALVEMDVPTRQSYVAAVVQPSERTFASGVTNLARNVFWALGSAIAGFLMQALTVSAPLLVGGGAKITYDLLLYRSFRKVKPPEEASYTASLTM
jgi:MFS family permease